MKSPAALIAVVCVVAGCGYSTRYVAPQGVRTVAVSVLENRTLYSGVEFELTDAIIKEIASKTPLRIAAAGEADAQLRGSLQDYGLRVLRRDTEGAVAEYQLRALVNMELISTDTGETLRKVDGAGWELSYLPIRGETEEAARLELLRRLARKVVARTFETW